MERDKTLALKFAKENFGKKTKISQAGKTDVLCWINNIEVSFSPIQIPNCTFFFFYKKTNFLPEPQFS